MEHLSAKPNIPNAETGHRHTSRKIAGVAASLLFLAGCASTEVSAEKSPHPVHETTVSTETPGITLQEAREALDSFVPNAAPKLREFSLDHDREKARQDAMQYLSLKKSKLAIVSYADLSLAQANAFGQTVEDRIASITKGTYKVNVDVYLASPIAKQLYSEETRVGHLDQNNFHDYSSVIADVAMPEIDTTYQSVIALTDHGFDGRSFAYYDGKYADIANVTKDYEAIMANGGSSESAEGLLNDPRNAVIHEWMHAIARLEHSKAATNNNGDLSGSLSGDPTSSHREVDLSQFLSSANIDEYAGGGIMGASHNIGDTLTPLTATELYETEAAERLLNVPKIINDSLVDETGVSYRPGSSNTNDLAILRLTNPLTDRADDVIDKLTFAPVHDEYGWRVEMKALTSDNASINLMTAQIQDGIDQSVTIFWDGGSIALRVSTSGVLNITANS